MIEMSKYSLTFFPLQPDVKIDPASGPVNGLIFFLLLKFTDSHLQKVSLLLKNLATRPVSCFFLLKMR